MADNAKTAQTAEELEQLLNELGEVETFPPPPEFRARARITDPDVYAAAARDPEAYWAGRARELHWDTPFTKVLDESHAPFVTWFADGTLNVSYNCLDRHVEAGLGDRVAYHWRGEEGEERAITYADLHRDVQRLANGLKDLGIGKGDVVGIFMPMIPEVVVAMLACARIGAPHNVVFGGFAPDSVRERMEVSHATSWPVRRTTTMCSMSRSPITSSTCCLIAAVLPLRRAPSTVISALASENSMRSLTESAEKPPKTTLCGAPMRAQASMATATSGIIGR